MNDLRNTQGMLFIGILAVNLVLALLYLIWNLIFPSGEEKRSAYFLKFFTMIMFPLVGLAYFSIGYILYRTVFHKDVNLADVVFSKERVKTNERADEERERNMAPLEEAIAISDKTSLRGLMLNIIKGDTKSTLAAIALALNSPDSETAHYAASVLQDELNNFRINVQKVVNEINNEEWEDTECELSLIPYMNGVLEQKVFTDMEQRSMVTTFVLVGEILYSKNPYQVTSQFFEWFALRLLEVRDFEQMEVWCKRAIDQYPEELSSYTCMLKLYFTWPKKEEFFKTMDALKQSSIVIDRETLELIRTFG